ncbi:zinc transporter, ZIP family [Persephonella hydrogeniphila]|uniref:Zinc transporter, ZIP family n=1 Tax=Persephonella hydrogeniphila TaxID=198703 RepID=A0A285NPZ2_9AQUI|nr:ZIP family metal transporter [Persephonella hydrogeniphila]SNZ09701.1 zinc transporter, ZIP family [Persephonella hydrogeniphila]
MNDLILAGTLVMLLTALGSVVAVLFKRLPEWGLDFSMAFSGGVMLVASFTSLILPSIEIGGAGITISGIISGFLLIYLIEKITPHEDYILKFNKGNVEKEKLKSIFLIVSAIIIHNIPEGMAVGVSMVNDIDKGWATAIAIGVQDIPEGLAVSLPLIVLTGRLWIPVLIGVLSGFSEFVFTILGGFTFTVLSIFLPFGLSLAGGAMIYVTVKEVFPEVYKNKDEGIVTFGFLIGLIVMLYLDTTLG